MRLPLLLALLLALAGCPKGDAASSGSAKAASWLTFDVVQAGTGNPLSAMVWPDGAPEDYETVVAGEAGQSVRFEGIGRREDGYALALKPGQWVSLRVWSPGHELSEFTMKLRRGENPVIVELVKAEVQDERVPEVIRTEVLEALPSAGPKSGS